MRSAPTRKSLILLLLPFLLSCGSLREKDERPESDLEVLRRGVETMLPTRDPAGDIKRAEDAENFEQAWSLLLDFEDVDFLHEQDKRRAVEFVNKAVEHLREARRPCTRWEKWTNRRNC